MNTFVTIFLRMNGKRNDKRKKVHKKPVAA